MQIQTSLHMATALQLHRFSLSVSCLCNCKKMNRPGALRNGAKSLLRVGSNHQPLDAIRITVERASQLRHEGCLLIVDLRQL